MRPEDVAVAERLSAEGFYELDVRAHRPGLPVPELRSTSRTAAWLERTAHFLETDAGGCWVAEDDTGMAGFATSYTRELMWCLATFAVRAGLQGQGRGPGLPPGAAADVRGGPAGRGSRSRPSMVAGACAPWSPRRATPGPSVSTGVPASPCIPRCS